MTLSELVPPPEGALAASFPQDSVYALIRVGGTEQRTPFMDATSHEQLGMATSLVFDIPHMIALDRGQQALARYRESVGTCTQHLNSASPTLPQILCEKGIE